MEKKKRVAVIGASGLVGQEIVRLLIERKFPLDTLKLFASEKSLGKKIHSIPLQILETLDDIDIAFFAAGSNVSKKWIPNAKCICIDSSSAFRDDYPLIIPEINTLCMKGNVFCSPNCAATILLMPLAPLHNKFKVKRVVISTYQAASGAGAKLLNHLKNETKALLENKEHEKLLPYPYAFNLYPHNSPLLANGYVEEEMKIASETQKILNDYTIKLSATCIRVPVLRAHAISANVEFHHPFSLDAIYSTLEKMPGLKVFENRELNRFATQFDVTGKNEVYCGRFRIDPTQPNTLEFWAVGDQLLKGAALNAVQIGEVYTSTPSSIGIYSQDLLSR